MRYPTGKERTAMTEAIADRANLEKQLAEQMQQKSEQKAQRLAEMLKAMGIYTNEI
jgi:predicted secreted protein